jgi:ubiquinone/menaquinone biosynthesis C-methylase UbiE
MGVAASILMNTFGRPRGVLGRLGGFLMARMNESCAAWVIGLLDIQPHDRVLEVGFGPGVAIQLLTRSTPAKYVAGVDFTREMVEQATTRNVKAIESGGAELRHGSVENLPFEDHAFDKALAINSIPVWPDAVAGLREMRRVMKAGGKIALGLTPYSGRSKDGVCELLTTAGFANTRIVESEREFCTPASKP